MKDEGEISKYLIALNCHPKIGSQTLKKALMPFRSSHDLWSCQSLELKKKLEPRIAELVLEARHNYNPDNEIQKLAQNDVGYITIYDPLYPKLLKEIPDAPVILYIRGNISALDKKGIGIVGSRKYSYYGKKVAYNLSLEGAKNGLSIISGLALGIDTFAHQAALDEGGTTVGVLGCGLDQIYPASNFQLAQAIVSNGGAIISEFPLGTPPLKQNFPARNRIIAGLSLGTLVVEAALESGALITAYQALEYNREVFAVPGNIDSSNSAGTNKLIKEGAKLVASVEDILENLQIEKRTHAEKAAQILPPTKEEEQILGVLDGKELSIDEIIIETGYNVILISSVISLMEMKGLIENLGGGQYRKI